MELRTVEGAGLAVGDGRLWIEAQDAQTAIKATCESLWEEHRKFNEETRAEYAKQIDDLRREANVFNAKWCEAEEKIARHHRAEEAMRDYEKTISEQCMRISELEDCRDWQAVEINKLKERELQIATDPKLRAAIRRKARTA
jgi:small-conductance mechanosensitive channel